MLREMDTEYFAQRILCTREGKQDCFNTVRQLIELAFAARDHGLLKMEDLIRDRVRFPDAFLRKAVNMVVEISNPDNIRKVLCNYILTTHNMSNHRFLNSVIIIEAMLAISRSEDLDYVFTYLVPSYFGIEYEAAVVDVYRNYKQSLIRERAAKEQQDPE